MSAIDHEIGKRVNDEYYAEVSAGRSDYWQKMAGPRHRVAVLLAQLRSAPPANLVDLGCGNGQLLKEIGRHFPRIQLAGIDLSDEQIKVNRNAAADIDWKTCDLDRERAVPSGMNGSYEAVVSSEVIEHVTQPLRFLENARLLAKPGGRLFLSTQSGPVHETERRVGHIRHFSKEEMARLLSAAGWEPTRIWNTGYPFHDWSKWFANLAPDRTMRDYSGSAYGWKQNAVCWGLRVAFNLNSTTRGYQLFAAATTR